VENSPSYEYHFGRNLIPAIISRRKCEATLIQRYGIKNKLKFIKCKTNNNKKKTKQKKTKQKQNKN
jgi:hypothetical protein